MSTPAPRPRDCSCAMTEESMRACTVHGENPNKYGLYEGYTPFYENQSTLLDFLQDVAEVPVSRVMRWLTMTPEEIIAGESSKMDPELVIRFEHLPRILQMFGELMQEQNRTDLPHSRSVVIPFDHAQINMTPEQMKMIIEYACSMANMDIIQLLRSLAIKGN